MTKEIAENFGVDESEVHYKKKDSEHGEHHEVFIGEYRIGTGLTQETAILDALKNGQYALEKGKRREKEKAE